MEFRCVSLLLEKMTVLIVRKVAITAVVIELYGSYRRLMLCKNMPVSDREVSNGSDGRGYITLHALLAAIAQLSRERVHAVHETGALYSFFQPNSQMPVATTQVYQVANIFQPVNGFCRLGSIGNCMMSMETIPCIQPYSAEQDHQHLVEQLCVWHQMDFRKVFIVIVGPKAAEVGQSEVDEENLAMAGWGDGVQQHVSNQTNTEAAGEVENNDSWSESAHALWQSDVRPLVDDDRRKSSVDNGGSLHADHLEMEGSVQWKLVEAVLTPEKSIDEMLTLVNVKVSVQRQAKWLGVALHDLPALYANYRAM